MERQKEGGEKDGLWGFSIYIVDPQGSLAAGICSEDQGIA
jgi:hypothetical protein